MYTLTQYTHYTHISESSRLTSASLRPNISYNTYHIIQRNIIESNTK